MMTGFKLHYRGHLTRAAVKLREGSTPEGATVQRRAGRITDKPLLESLRRAGLLTASHSGPRGGLRYYTTPAGLDALREASEEIVEDIASLQVGSRVEGGLGEDYDTGTILSIDGDIAVVAWSGGIRTREEIATLRAEVA